MTSLVAVRKNGVAVLAADTLSRYGSTREESSLIANHDKLLAVGDAWLAPAGPASAQLVIASHFRNPDVIRDFSTCDEVFETVRAMQQALKDDYFLNPKEDESDPFDSLQMELLIASPGGIFGVYPLRSVQEYTRYYAFGSGASYALGALHALYDDIDDPRELAGRALEAACCFDDGSALPSTVRSVRLDD